MNDYTSDAGFHPNDQTILAAPTLGMARSTLDPAATTWHGRGFETPRLPKRDGLCLLSCARRLEVFDDEGGFGDNVTTAVPASAYRAARASRQQLGACDTRIGYCNLYKPTRGSLTRSFGTRTWTRMQPGHGDHFSSAMTGKIARLDRDARHGQEHNHGRAEARTSRDGLGRQQPPRWVRDRPTSADNASDIADFSSRGPVQDGRIKPDLVAPAATLWGRVTGPILRDNRTATSACATLLSGGPETYTWSSGTSHSAPVVAGGAALALSVAAHEVWRRAQPRACQSLYAQCDELHQRAQPGESPGTRARGGGCSTSSACSNRTSGSSTTVAVPHLHPHSGAPFEITGVVNDPAKEFRVDAHVDRPAGNSATTRPMSISSTSN